MEFDSKRDLFSVSERYLREIYLYKTVHGRKLLEASFLAVLRSKTNLEVIKRYAGHIAIAGQLKNDIYDFTKHKKYRGLSDLDQGHITWPLFLLIRSLSDQEQKELARHITDKNFDEIINLMRSKKIIERVVDLINFHVEKAKGVIRGKFTSEVERLLNLWAEGNRHFTREPRV